MSYKLITVHQDSVEIKTLNFNDWTISTGSNHILRSACLNPTNCDSLDKNEEKCIYCQFLNELLIPHFPDMTFAKNFLRIEHKNGFGIEFKALNALKDVKERCLGPSITADNWKTLKNNEDYIKRLKNFDWTFATYYTGHLFSKDDEQSIKIEPTEECIDFEKLKLKEEIIYFDEIILFEDELADNGLANLGVKIRVMPEKIFVLLRYFLRVDKVKIKIFETRYFYELNQKYFLKEFTIRECDQNKMKELSIPVQNDPVALTKVLPLKKIIKEKLIFP